MRIGEVIRFKNERFFEGAVQLNWLQQRPEQARVAAEAFVFHGPRYHGAGKAEQEGVEGSYKLKDTASFVKDLLVSLEAGDTGQEINPFWMAVAGYGSGKSHLALTMGVILSDPRSSSTQTVLKNIERADPQIGHEVVRILETFDKPALILALDGTSGFHLGNALSRAVFQQLRQQGIDTQAIRDLSPRFQTAEQFVERNFSVRTKAFGEALPGLEATDIISRLRENDEDVYEKVDELYAEANGHAIPVEGQESAQGLIETLSKVYCGEDGPFSHVVILFDELGRYLEYAAEKPNVAGDYVLQQLFQGIQDNSGKVHFVGFIQYELKTYLKRFKGQDLRHLQRYVTRFDAAEKWYLSTNLETIFASMISKNEDALDQLWKKTGASIGSAKTAKILGAALPGFSRYPVWSEPQRFEQVIARGCWPLHPFAVWFLTRQRDVVQSRSALTFVKDVIESIEKEDAVVGGRLRQVSAAQIILGNMLSELVAAEREVGGNLAETLQMLLEKYEGHLNWTSKLTLAGAAVLEKARVGRQAREAAEDLLCEATALPRSDVEAALIELSELGALEWNEDLGGFELLSEGASRGQFQQWLRKELASFDLDAVRDLFIRRGTVDLGLEEVRPDFAQEHGISTQDWYFDARLAHAGTIEQAVQTAFQEWRESISPKEAKGKLIYLYLHSEDDLNDLEERVRKVMAGELKRDKRESAPIWVVAIEDTDGAIAEGLSRLHIFDEKTVESDRERFRRFISTDRQRAWENLRRKSRTALSQRIYWIAGFEMAPDGRLSHVAKEIFSRVYPNVIPFPFDGFATSAGAGPADAALLARSLIARQVSGPWVQAQTRRLQNRVHALLMRSWQALDRSGALRPPRAEGLRQLYKMLEADHRHDPSPTLLESYRKLIAPPFGMNASSAAIMLGLLLGLDKPQRRIEMNGEFVASGEWANRALPGKRGQHFFEHGILEESRLVFLSKKVEDRWRDFLLEWEEERNLERKLHFLSKAEKMLRVDPLPESQEGTYKYLCDRADKAREELFEFRRKISVWERGIEKAEKRTSVSHELRIGAELVDVLDLIEENPEWSESDVTHCKTLLEMVKELVNRDVQGWIPRQVCRTAVQVADFRQRTTEKSNQLRKLGFNKEASALERQRDRSIARVEETQKIQFTLDQAQEYPRLPLPKDTDTVRYLQDRLKKGDELIARIQQATKALTEPEIKALVREIKDYQGKIQEILQHHKATLAAVYELQLATKQDILNASLELSRLRQIFASTQDESDILELVVQLEKIQSDIQAWDSGDIPVERQREILQALVKKQIEDLRAYLKKKEIEPWWDPEAIYLQLSSQRIQEAERRSTEWVNARLKSIGDVSSLEPKKCEELIAELTEVPGFLSKNDLRQVNQMRSTLEKRLAELQEKERKVAVTTWQKRFVDLRVEELDKPNTEKLLQELNNPPVKLRPEEMETLTKIQERLVTRLDQLSLDELYSRILRLSDKQQRKLLAMLEKLVPRDFASRQ